MKAQDTSHEVQQNAAQASSPSPFSVIGWTLLCFALIPLTMAAHADGHGYTIVGVSLGVVSIVCIALGKLLGKRSGGKVAT